MTRKDERRRLIKYAVFAFWFVSFILTVALYEQDEVSYPVRNPKTNVVTLRTVAEGYETQQIVLMFLGVGLFLWIGSLLVDARSSRVPRPALRYQPRYRNRRGIQRVFHGGELRCPRCSGIEIHRSRRTGADWILGIFLVSPYRCYTCFQRFYRRAHPCRAA